MKEILVLLVEIVEISETAETVEISEAAETVEIRRVVSLKCWRDSWRKMLRIVRDSYKESILLL